MAGVKRDSALQGRSGRIEGSDVLGRPAIGERGVGRGGRKFDGDAQNPRRLSPAAQLHEAQTDFSHQLWIVRLEREAATEFDDRVLEPTLLPKLKSRELVDQWMPKALGLSRERSSDRLLQI